MNVLITSVGRRTSVIKYFKRELKNIGNLVVTDCSNLAPALYLADKQYIVPKIDHPEYIHVIKNICKKEKISAVLSLIDPELSLLAKNIDEFKELGVTLVVSPYEACELWFDKFKASEFCEKQNFLFANTFNSYVAFEEAFKRGEIQFPVFIKPQKGSASLNVNKAKNMNEANIIFNSSENMIIQEYLDGKELGVDVYVDLISKKVISTFIKEKTSMRAGETDKAKSIKSEKLFTIINELVTKAGLVGPLDIDVFEVNGEYYISEINPRFGGGYPLAYECGINFSKYLINNLKGNVNEPNIGNYEENVLMMKYESLLVEKTCNIEGYKVNTVF